MDTCAVTVEIAGVPARLICRREIAALMKDYLSDREPLFTAEAHPRTTERLLKMHRRSMAALGRTGYPEPVLQAESLALHIALCAGMLDYNVLMLHASAVCLDNEAYVFTAPSGTGKSTHAGLWLKAFGTRAYIINDDKPMLRIYEDRIEVFGSPWTGKHGRGCPGHAPLKAAVALRRGTDNSVEPISPAEAFSLLHGRAFGDADPEIMARTLPLKKALAERAPFFRLNMDNLKEDAAERCLEGLISYG